MRIKMLLFVLAVLVLLPGASRAGELPQGFVYLKNADPTIRQDIRYHGSHNFLGRPIPGYESPECILTVPAAQALKRVQEELLASGYTLKVYDCYRPQRAVDAFVEWAEDPADDKMRAENYPRVSKDELFPKGYVAAKSSHTRGSTVDLTILDLPVMAQADYHDGEKLVDCAAPYNERFQDNSADMGTGFDCMDPLSHPLNKAVGTVPYHNRMTLRELMVKNGFAPYEEEWWHFTLEDEPFPDTYFDFPVTADSESDQQPSD